MELAETLVPLVDEWTATLVEMGVRSLHTFPYNKALEQAELRGLPAILVRLRSIALVLLFC